MEKRGAQRQMSVVPVHRVDAGSACVDARVRGEDAGSAYVDARGVYVDSRYA